MKLYTPILFVIIIFLSSCWSQKIETGKDLPGSTITLIRSLGLLDSNEQIIKYYSNFKKDKAGSFFTDKRIAHYWLDDNSRSESDTSFCLYENIISIDTIYHLAGFNCPYMTVTKKDSSSFRVYADGSRDEIKQFYETAMKLWKQKKLKK